MVVSRDEDHLRQWSNLQGFDHAETVQTGHLHVQKNQIGTLRLDQSYGLQPRARLAGDLEILFSGQEAADLTARRVLVVHNHNANLGHSRSLPPAISVVWQFDADHRSTTLPVTHCEF